MKKSIGFIAIAIAILGYYFSSNDQVTEESIKESVQVEEHSHSHSHDHNHKKKTKSKVTTTAKKLPTKPDSKQVNLPPFKPSNKKEENLKKIAEIYKDIYSEKLSSKEFANKLKKVGLKPLISKSSNPFTGGMNMVRTSNAIEGTRYIHGQFLVDENGNEFMQHGSVEFPPGPGQLEKTAKAWASLLGIESTPTISNTSFISYKLTEDYIIWFKKMGIEDLKDDPYNAYSPKDEGTIRMAIEIEIHGEEHDSHVFPEDN